MNKLISKARITEVDTLSDALVRLYAADGALAPDVFLKDVMAEVESLSASLTAAIRQDKAVSKLDEADAERDSAVRNLGRLIEGYTAIPIPEMKSAAERLWAVFGRYGGAITGESYAAESSLIESLLGDLGAEELADAVGALGGVADLVGQLRAAQGAFNRANDEYNAAASVKKESATSLKKPLLAAINEKLVPYLGAMAMANAALYGDFASKAEEEIKRANETIAKRGK